MAKKLADIIKGVKSSKVEPLTTGKEPGVDYAGKMKDERDFVANHAVEKHADRVGNDDKVYKGTTKHAELKTHGYKPKAEVKEETTEDGRKVYSIDVGNLTKEMAEQYVKEIMAEISDDLEEDVAALAEVSDETVRSMRDKAQKEIAFIKTSSPKGGHMARKYLPGLKRKVAAADKRLAKSDDVNEAVEQIDEISDKLVDGYRDQALLNRKHAERFLKYADDEKSKKHWTGYKERMEKHARTANKRLGRRETDYYHNPTPLERLFKEQADCKLSKDGVCENHADGECPTKNNNKEPRFNGKDKPGKRQLLTDKKTIQEKAESVAQQKIMAMALAYKKDPASVPDASDEIKKLAKSMTADQLRDYAETKHKGLPQKTDEGFMNMPSSPKTATEISRNLLHKAMEKTKDRNFKERQLDSQKKSEDSGKEKEKSKE